MFRFSAKSGAQRLANVFSLTLILSRWALVSTQVEIIGDYLSFCRSESQRDSATKPRVVPSAGLPWVRIFKVNSTPTGLHPTRLTMPKDATPLGLMISWDVLPRVARRLATLGFGAQSLWDWGQKRPQNTCVDTNAQRERARVREKTSSRQNATISRRSETAMNQTTA